MSNSEISVSVKSVVDPNTNSAEELEKPLFIMISKSRPEYIYPLVYEQEFPFFAKETVIDESTFGCSDDLNAYETTCGW